MRAFLALKRHSASCSLAHLWPSCRGCRGRRGCRRTRERGARTRADTCKGRKRGKEEEDLEEMEDATKKENNATRFTTPVQRRLHSRVRARFRHESHDKTPFPSVVSVTKATNIVIFFGGRQPLHLRHILNQRQPKVHQCLIVKVKCDPICIGKGTWQRDARLCDLREGERESMISLEGH